MESFISEGSQAVFERLQTVFDTVAKIADIFGIMLAGIATLISVRALNEQRRFNRISTSPFAEIISRDRGNTISIVIRNSGTGVLKVASFQVSDSERTERSIGAFMPDPRPFEWTANSGGIENRRILPGKTVKLIEITLPTGDDEAEQLRKDIRARLSKLTCNLSYIDPWGHPCEPVTKKLSWFKRQR